MTRWHSAILAVLGLMVAPLAAARTAKALPKPQTRIQSASRKPSATVASGRKVAPSLPTPARRQGSVSANLRTTTRGQASAAASKRRPALRRRVYYNPWKEPTYADSAEGDLTAGEDPVVRRAALAALGPLNGSVVVVDPRSGRILSVVNQDLAFTESFTPCSTIKIFVGLAGLSEAVIDRTMEVRVGRRTSLNLTEALARSDNPYFQVVGTQLGFDRVSYYARLFGLGERATTSGREIPGVIASAPPDGVGYLSSHGHGVKLSPLQLAAAMSAIANGGTLYHLQYPESQTEAARLVPRVKRHIEVERLLPEVKPGLMAAVEEGTARRAGFDPDEPIYGKTGTCTDRDTPTHLGWFGSFNEVDSRSLVVVVLLTGGAPINGPVASGVAGRVYRNLSEHGYYGQPRPVSPVALVETTSGFGQP